MIKFEEHEGKLFRMLEKPEPIFTTGDKVTDGVIEGSIIHIEDAIADVCPSTDEYKIELRNLNHIPESPKKDDVEKPKPLLAEAKVGDLCQRRDGKWVQVDSYSNDRPCPVMCKSDIGGQDCFTLDGRNHNAVNNDKDIIHTEPLAPEGTAEWALQMMRLGNKVRNRDWDGGTYEKSLLYCQLIGETIKYNEGCSAFDVCLSDWEAPYIKNTGWQIYEPKPESQYKVGDWVEWCGDQYMVESATQVMFCARYIESLEAENANLKADNRSLVEQMNKMAMRMEHKSGTTQRRKS